MEEQLDKKARRELKRAEKLRSRERERKGRLAKKLAVWAGSIVIAAALLFFALQAFTPQELGQDSSRSMPSEGAGHVAEGTRVHYRSNPPSSGSHWPTPLRDGVYDTEKPAEAIVHSLEHGRVWVSYNPEIGQAAIDQLEEAVKGQGAVIVTPRPQNETDIALSAWTRIDTFDLSEDGSVDTKRVRDFITRYRHQGPEYILQDTGKDYE